MPKAISIDIESLSLRTDCVILQVGFVVFDTGSLHHPDSESKVHFNSRIMKQLGFAHDLATETWWRDTNASLFEQILECGFVQHADMQFAVTSLWNELKAHCADETEIWARGPQFDCNALANLFAHFGLKTPWKHNMVRDSRTLYAISNFQEAPWSESIHSVQHDALNDAKKEASDIQTCLHLMRLAGVKR